jgi:hypothetical protein
MFALDALVDIYPNARFLWSHRDPTKVLGSVCSLIHYTRSWSSDRDDAVELGAQQLELWSLAVDRAMGFRNRLGDERFADIAFEDLQLDPVAALAKGLNQVGIDFEETSGRAVSEWATAHPPGSVGTHSYELSEFGLEAEQIRERFSSYYAAFEVKD